MNSLSLLVLALFAACVSCFTEVEYQNAFTNWMQTYQKVYASEEFQNRYAVFKFNMDYVTKWNSMNTETELGLTVFADLSNEEYRKIYLGTRVTKSVPAFDAIAPKVGLPTSVDWRNQSAVTPIKDQGQCGSCWSFSTTGSTEGIHAISTKNLVSLSEQNLMDCSKKYGNQGCNGGLMDQAFQYIIDNKGIDTEASYPYKAADGPCKFNAANVGATIQGYVNVTTGSENALQVAAVQQPVSVAIDASANSFQLYKKGVYYEPSCSSSQLDHGVLVVGYGNDGSSAYWLVKNSWGTSWGQQGYIWMSRNRNNNCGIATMASYPTVSGSSASATAGHSTSASASNSNSNSGHSSNSGNSNSNSGHSASNSNSGHSANSGNSNSGNSGNSGNSASTYSAVGTEQYKQNKGGVGFKPFKDQTAKFNF